MSTLALIPARSGSKGILGKNTRTFSGRPLLAWAVEIGKQTCDRTFVSTNDPAIGHLAAQYGASVIVRPNKLAQDDTPMLPVVQHALRAVEPWRPTYVVLLQPTQPFRTADHVIAAINMLDDTLCDSVVSVVRIPQHYAPDYAVRVDSGRLNLYLPDGPTRRQDTRPAYTRDGTVYAIRREVIDRGSLYGTDCRALVIPDSQSVNLDTPEDWERAEAMRKGA
jgi:CMP-N,N'-diacetyllegionaminic acid synthase